MKLVEIYFWDSMYLIIYLALSLYLHVTNNEGTTLGTIIIGLIFTGILSIILYFQEGILLEDKTPTIKESASKEKTENFRVKKKREYKKHKMEVKNIEEKQNQELVQFFEGIEPEPKMRTDVDLNELDTDDDDKPN